MVSLSQPNAVDARPTRPMTSLALSSTTLPMNTVSTTYSTFSLVDDYSLAAQGDNLTFDDVYFHTPFLACVFEL